MCAVLSCPGIAIVSVSFRLVVVVLDFLASTTAASDRIQDCGECLVALSVDEAEVDRMCAPRDLCNVS